MRRPRGLQDRRFPGPQRPTQACQTPPTPPWILPSRRRPRTLPRRPFPRLSWPKDLRCSRWARPKMKSWPFRGRPMRSATPIFNTGRRTSPLRTAALSHGRTEIPNSRPENPSTGGVCWERTVIYRGLEKRRGGGGPGQAGPLYGQHLSIRNLGGFLSRRAGRFHGWTGSPRPERPGHRDRSIRSLENVFGWIAQGRGWWWPQGLPDTATETTFTYGTSTRYFLPTAA